MGGVTFQTPFRKQGGGLLKKINIANSKMAAKLAQKTAPKAKTATASKGWQQFSSKEISDAKRADAALDREFEEFARQIAHPDDPSDVQQDVDGWETFSDQEIKGARNQRTEEQKQRAEALKQQAEEIHQEYDRGMAPLREQQARTNQALRRFS